MPGLPNEVTCYCLPSQRQTSGFRHVIGTLWEVNDKLCTDMARLTYEGIRDGGMTDDSVCLGLHNASRELRNSWLKRTMGKHDREKQHKPTTLNACDIVVRSEGGGSGGRSKLPRDIIPVEEKHPASWISYVHFGV